MLSFARKIHRSVRPSALSELCNANFSRVTSFGLTSHVSTTTVAGSRAYSSSRSLQNSVDLKHLFNIAKDKLSIIPVGLKTFWSESKDVKDLLTEKNVQVSDRSRRQKQQVAKYKKDFLLMLMTAAIFCVPGVGNLVVLVQLKYPKTLMTTHFWTKEQWNDFELERYSTKMKVLKQVEIHKNKNRTNDVAAFLDISPKILIDVMPDSILISTIDKRITGIMNDDKCIMDEDAGVTKTLGNIDSMTVQELWTIIIDRGIKDDKCNSMQHFQEVSVEHLRGIVRSWIHISEENRRSMLMLM